jgi:hypothetical protein
MKTVSATATAETATIETVEQLIAALQDIRAGIAWSCCFLGGDLPPIVVQLVAYDDEALGRWTLELAPTPGQPIDAAYAGSSVHADDSDALLALMAHSMFEDLAEQIRG